jgi:F-type H+-transporting ATPase subunit gamma
MEQLARLTARIGSLRELRDLFRAMRALAASHVQEAQTTLPGIRRYAQVIEDAIARAALLLPASDDRPPDVASAGTNVLVVVCAEQGFTGAFNELLLDRAVFERVPGQQLGVIGHRGARLAEERGIELDWSVPMATHVGGVVAAVRQVARQLEGTSGASVVYGGYRKGGRFEVEARTILPLDPSLLTGAVPGDRPLHQLPPEMLLQRLASEYLFAEITRSVMESLASENGARLHRLEAADHNIGEKLDGLVRRERRVRQEATTAEMLDVVTGTEAILGSASGRP